MNCIKCNQETADFHFRALEVQTFHVRDMTRQSKIQALGDFQEFSLCRSCAEEKLRGYLQAGSRIGRIAIPCTLLTLAGLVLTVVFWKGEGALRLLGLGMTGCGILCMAGLLGDIFKKRRLYAALSPDKALKKCAWECVLEQAPHKDGDNDLTYIPVTEETLGRKNGDLMILYDLVPEIAVEAHKRIHGQDSSQQEP